MANTNTQLNKTEKRELLHITHFIYEYEDDNEKFDDIIVELYNKDYDLMKYSNKKIVKDFLCDICDEEFYEEYISGITDIKFCPISKDYTATITKQNKIEWSVHLIKRHGKILTDHKEELETKKKETHNLLYKKNKELKEQISKFFESKNEMQTKIDELKKEIDELQKQKQKPAPPIFG